MSSIRVITGQRAALAKTHKLLYPAAILFLISGLLLLIPPPCLGGSGNLMLIIDASGSMWGQVEGRSKIEIAREVMSGLIYELPEDLNVGLVAYGHRRKGDCSDVEQITALGPLNKPNLAAQIQRLKPKGKTPITRSVRQTAQSLQHLEDETTILLVSDGKETCEGDPCALVRELKESGIKFVMHVIGFDVTAAEREQLQCMADAGGGTYYTASNAREFKQAIQEIQHTGHLNIVALRNGTPIAAEVRVTAAGQAVAAGTTTVDRNESIPFKLDAGSYRVSVSDPEIPGLDPIIFDAVEIGGGASVERVAEFAAARLRLSATRNDQPTAAIYLVTEAGQAKSLVDTTSAQAQAFWLAPGSVDVAISESGGEQPETVRFEAVTLTAGETVERIADFSDGRLRIRATSNGQSIRARVGVLIPDEERDAGTFHTSTDPQRPAEITLEPGIYTAVVIDETRPGMPEVVFGGLEITKGGLVEQTADFSDGTLQIIALRNGELIPAEVAVIPVDKPQPVVIETTTQDLDKPLKFKLPLGSYKLRVTDTENPARPSLELTGVEISAGKVNEQVAEFKAAILDLRAVKNNKPVSALGSMTMLPDGVKKSVVLSASEEPKRLFLESGAYDIVVTHGKGDEKRQAEFKSVEIALGDTVEKVADFSDGWLDVVALANGEPLPNHELEVTVFRSGEPQPFAKFSEDHGFLPPGLYDVRSDLSWKRIYGAPVSQLTRGVHIEGGETTKLTPDWNYGTLRGKGLGNGKPLPCHRTGVTVYLAGESKSLVSGLSGCAGNFAAGVYDVSVEYNFYGETTRRFENIEVKDGKEAVVTGEWEFGVLKIRGILGGKQVPCYASRIEVYPAGEKEYLTWHLSGCGARFAPGSYDIVIDAKGYAARQDGVQLNAGETVQVDVDLKKEGN